MVESKLIACRISWFLIDVNVGWSPDSWLMSWYSYNHDRLVLLVLARVTLHPPAPRWALLQTDPALWGNHPFFQRFLRPYLQTGCVFGNLGVIWSTIGHFWWAGAELRNFHIDFVTFNLSTNWKQENFLFKEGRRRE